MMRKLNRKGFTLVELLAVIIILAIVVGITIPAILTTTQKARQKAFQTSVESFANWLDRQYEAYKLDNDLLMSVNSDFEKACIDKDTNSANTTCNITSDLLIAGGLKPDNYNLNMSLLEHSEIKFKDGKFCVKLVGSADGEYSTTDSMTNNEECFKLQISGALSKDSGTERKARLVK